MSTELHKLSARQLLGDEGASTGIMKSLWATQTPQRAQRLAQQMLTGEWVFEPGV